MKTENLTLRDSFALAAMQSLLHVLLTDAKTAREAEEGLPCVTSDAYRIADLMLLERLSNDPRSGELRA